MTQEKVFNRWLVVVGALIIQLCLGSIYAYGVFAKPLKAYFADNSDLENQLPFAFGLLSFALVMAFYAGKWQDKIGPQKVAMTGGVVLGVGIMLSGMVDSLEALYITYGVIGGAGIGLAYVCPIAALVKWFPDKKGLISGIAVAGFGAGALIFASMGTAIMTGDLDASETDFLKDKVADVQDDNDIVFLETETDLSNVEITILLKDETNFETNQLAYANGTLITAMEINDLTGLEDAKDVSDKELELLTADPAGLSEADNKTRMEGLEDAQKAVLAAGKSDIYAKFDWQKAFQILGVIFLVGVVGASFLLVNPPEGYKPEGWQPPAPKTTATGEAVKVDYEWQDMIKTPTFMMLWGMFFLAATSGLMTIGNIGKFAADKDISAADIAMIIGVLSLANGAGRVGWGAVSDMIGRTKTLTAMYVVQAITMFLLFSMGNSVATLAFGAALVGFCFGGNFAMFPSATADYFGTKNVGQNYGMVFTSYGIAGIMGAIVAGLLYESTGSFAAIFMIMSGLSVVAILISLVTSAPGEKPMGLGAMFGKEEEKKPVDDSFKPPEVKEEAPAPVEELKEEAPAPVPAEADEDEEVLGEEGTCIYCGSDDDIHKAHLIAPSKGGKKKVFACAKCNTSKGDKALMEWLRWVKENRPERWDLISGYNKIMEGEVAEKVQKIHAEPGKEPAQDEPKPEPEQ